MPMDAKEKEGLAAGPPTVCSGLNCRGKQKKSGGLGNSHTAPCGAAVPARPPTRSSETTHLHCRPQWVSGATRRGTWVVVQTALFSSERRRNNHTKSFNRNRIHLGLLADSRLAIPNSTTSHPPQLQPLSHSSLTKSVRLKDQDLQLLAGIRSLQLQSFPLTLLYPML